MGNNKQSRKYLLTINNPVDHHVTHETLKDTLNAMNCTYWAMCDEVGEKGTPHTHVYLVRKSPIRFDTMKRKFPAAHIDTAYGTSTENRDYLLKQGKWTETKKSETSVEGSFEEFGELPNEALDDLSVHEKLIDLIDQGRSNAEIIKELPQSVYHVKDMDMIRQSLLAEKYRRELRELNVTYIFGPSTVDITGLIYSRHDPGGIFRITNYRNGHGLSFDQYFGEDVVVFEEFHSEVPITTMLPMIDRYPLYLPARYADKVACYSYVYFASDIPPELQYQDQAFRNTEMYQLFLARINNIVKIDKEGEMQVLKGTWEVKNE